MPDLGNGTWRVSTEDGLKVTYSCNDGYYMKDYYMSGKNTIQCECNTTTGKKDSSLKVHSNNNGPNFRQQLGIWWSPRRYMEVGMIPECLGKTIGHDIWYPFSS